MIEEDTNDLAVQYALGILPRKQVPDFESQLKVDAELQDLVSDIQRINEWDAEESPSVEVPIDGYSRILEQLTARPAPPSETRTNIIPFLSWAGWGLAACFAAAFFMVRSSGPSEVIVASRPEAGSSAIIVSELTAARPSLTSASVPAPAGGGVELRVLELANLAEAFWSSRLGDASSGNARTLLADAKVRTREAVESSSEGFTVFDRELRMGVIAVDALPPAKPNRSYHIWARHGPEETPVWAGTIPIGESDGGLFFFDLTDSAVEVIQAQNLSFFITEESTLTPDRPKGRVVLTGL